MASLKEDAPTLVDRNPQRPQGWQPHVLSSDRDDEVLLEGQLVSCQRPVWLKDSNTSYTTLLQDMRRQT